MNISESIVSNALYDEIKVWANRSCQAVGSVSLPPLPKDNSLLHSAVWFNFGLDAGKNLMPSVAYAAGQSRLTVVAGHQRTKILPKALRSPNGRCLRNAE